MPRTPPARTPPARTPPARRADEVRLTGALLALAGAVGAVTG
ncbi:hypothetical protein [Kineococcus sp. TRM81007]|nr:hypothetical protein [Kineococcus sp. TRM81007]